MNMPASLNCYNNKGETRWENDEFQICKELIYGWWTWIDVDNTIVDCSNSANCLESNGEKEYRCVKLGTDDYSRWYKTSYLQNSANLEPCLDYTYNGDECADDFGHRNKDNDGWIEHKHSEDDINCADSSSFDIFAIFIMAFVSSVLFPFSTVIPAPYSPTSSATSLPPVVRTGNPNLSISFILFRAPVSVSTHLKSTFIPALLSS